MTSSERSEIWQDSGVFQADSFDDDSESRTQGTLISTSVDLADLKNSDFAKWTYAEVAELLKFDEDLKPLREVVKEHEISGEALLKVFKTESVPIDWKELPSTVWKKLKKLREEIEDVLSGPPPIQHHESCNESETSDSFRHRRLSSKHLRSRTSIGGRSVQSRRSVQSTYLDSEGEGPLDRYVTKSVTPTDENSVDDRVQAKLKLGNRSISKRREVAIMSYSSGENKKGFRQWIESECQELTKANNGKGLRWEQVSETNENQRNRNQQTSTSKRDMNDEIVEFMSEPKNLEKMKYLILSEEQKRATLKILYALVTRAYILNQSFIKTAKKKKMWPNPRSHEHKSWMTLEERKKLGHPLNALKIGIFGDFPPPSISRADIIQLIKLGGGDLQNQKNLLRKSSDVVIISDGLSSADNKYLEEELMKNRNDIFPDIRSSSSLGKATRSQPKSSSSSMCGNGYCEYAEKEANRDGVQSKQTQSCDSEHPPFLVNLLWLIETIRVGIPQNPANFEHIRKRTSSKRLSSKCREVEEKGGTKESKMEMKEESGQNKRKTTDLESEENVVKRIQQPMAMNPSRKRRRMTPKGDDLGHEVEENRRIGKSGTDDEMELTKDDENNEQKNVKNIDEELQKCFPGCERPLRYDIDVASVRSNSEIEATQRDDGGEYDKENEEQFYQKKIQQASLLQRRKAKTKRSS